MKTKSDLIRILKCCKNYHKNQHKIGVLTKTKLSTSQRTPLTYINNEDRKLQLFANGLKLLSITTNDDGHFKIHVERKKRNDSNCGT